MANLKFYTKTSKGPRENNQDNLCAFMPDEDTYFFAIADGMGGGRAGNVASQLVIDRAKSYLFENLSKSREFSVLRKVLYDIFMEAQIELQRNIEKNNDLNGMGTTLTCILIYKNKYIWGNIGDSRIYRLHDNHIEQITKDHTYISDINVDPESQQSIASNYGHILTKAIDGGVDEPDIYPINDEYEILDKPTSFILCSDGLITDKSDSDPTDFYKIYEQSGSLDSICYNLIESAYQKGSTDNTSVILVDYEGGITRKSGGDYKPVTPTETKTKRRIGYKPFVLATLVFIVILLISFGLYKYLTESKKITEGDSFSTHADSIDSSALDPKDFNEKNDSDKIITNSLPDESFANESKEVESNRSVTEEVNLDESVPKESEQYQYYLKWDAFKSSEPQEITYGISWFEYDTSDLNQTSKENKTYNIINSDARNVSVKKYIIHLSDYESKSGSKVKLDTTLESRIARLSKEETDFILPGNYKIEIKAILSNNAIAISTHKNKKVIKDKTTK